MGAIIEAIPGQPNQNFEPADSFDEYNDEYDEEYEDDEDEADEEGNGFVESEPVFVPRAPAKVPSPHSAFPALPAGSRCPPVAGGRRRRGGHGGHCPYMPETRFL
ncbi:MAG: hypothetical protein KME26_25540 [Oscillatoria princeps RMCB-10]|nr:hypothetical protein [Oscillatoria princeps RMCB-10]